MQPEGLPESFPENSHLYRFLAQNGFFRAGGSQPPALTFQDQTFYPFEGSVVTDITPQDKALAALRNHKEAEKKRRERINSHFDRLRTILPCSSKTDKASLLAKVVQRLRELKQEVAQLPGTENYPSEIDEISVIPGEYSGEGEMVFKASLCCDDRADLVPDLIEILRSLNLKTLRAEMATLGGRVRSVLFVAAEREHSVESVRFLQSELKTLVEKSGGGAAAVERSKRRKVSGREQGLTQ